MAKYDSLIQRLDAVGELGVTICREAAAALRELSAAMDELEKRHADSRADKLAAAYAGLRAELDTLRQISWDLSPIISDDEVDFELCVAAAKRLRDRVKAIEGAADAEKIGAAILEKAARADVLDAENSDLTRRVAEGVGLEAKQLSAVGIEATDFKVDQPAETIVGLDGQSVMMGGATVARLTLRGIGRGGQYLGRLFSELQTR